MNMILPLGAVDVNVVGHFATVLVFVLIGFAFAGLALGVAKLLRPSAPNANKLTPYECGEVPLGSAWTRFNVGYYIFALLVLVFEVEVIFLFPWAAVLRDVGIVALVEGGIFLFILVFGFAFAWR